MNEPDPTADDGNRCTEYRSMLPGWRLGKDHKTYRHICRTIERDTVCYMVPKLLRMIERLDPHSLSYACKLALLCLQISCKKSDIP